MRNVSARASKFLLRGVSGIVLATAIGQATTAHAQPAQSDDPAEAAGVGESGNENEIVVTGSRIERAGFDQPTPTTVIGNTELRQSAPSNLAQVLNDQPSVRPSVVPATTVANTGAGTAPVDLRGLGVDRTLTLINGRRFVGQNNLNFVPLNMVERLEVVTGGASAAWGSGAVAGVVNIILNDDLEGLQLGAEAGISSRGDGERYRFDGAFGTHFAGGQGHFMIGAEYVDDRGIPPHGRRSRPQLGAGLTVVNGQLAFANDVNIPGRSYSGLILDGVLAGQTFNADGTLRPYRGPDASSTGGEDSSHLWDDFYAASPIKRFNAYARVSYDIGSNATIWADLAYGRTDTNYDFFTDFLAPGDIAAGGPITIFADNAFLSPAIRDQLAAAGETSFSFSRAYRDILQEVFDAERENIEGAIGINGTFGNGWKYQAHYSHGQIEDVQFLRAGGLRQNVLNAADAVSSGGQIVCRVNADVDPTNDDAACRPINIFGENNSSAEAIDYISADQGQRSVQKLDSLGAEIQGDLFSLWAGPVTVAVGVEARWEEITSTRPQETIDLINSGALNLPGYTADLNGGFNVKEAFAEMVLPLLDAEGVKLDFNGAARYSDYSNSGGIWSWKVGGTARLFNDLLLRATRSRDIRSPNIADLFSTQNTGIGAITDLDPPANPPPGYDPNPDFVTLIFGGNPDLQPEISSTLTIGGSYSPSFLRGLSLSVDYFDIKIEGAIVTLLATDITRLCGQGVQTACDAIIRDPVTQTVTRVFSNAQNLAEFQTRGWDIEAAYVLPMSQIAGDKPGSLRFRALATYVDKYIFSSGGERAGEVGDFAVGIPKWRGTFSATYQDDVIGLDTRIRYVGGGVYTRDVPGIVNNKIDARIYVDIGAQLKVMDKFTFFGNVSNLFDRSPPFIQQQSNHYDIMGRYFTFGARVNF
ncbi:TonB-dependent receptor plug domain-containing protein [Sphingosinicella rhizophila]|uniref:TonB-dependent receptor n=1 Tax=Sphingosinicella rhizophila TaxID=3050082 RepID=A0ABU3QAS7_9SPHN|nr:TonB-dependent receptor [Sphingosinicella sp. GR2756]MDT9600515.1 TonB-dependent receptor [Sphingosinicella sp. GR2756]